MRGKKDAEGNEKEEKKVIKRDESLKVSGGKRKKMQIIMEGEKILWMINASF